MSQQNGHDDAHHHIIPKKTLVFVFLALIGLTIFTVITAEFVDLGGTGNIILALAIASTKALLVVTFFMALKYDTPVNTLVFSVGALFVVVFLVFTLFDTAFRGDFGNVDRLTIRERALQDSLMRARDPDPSTLIVAPGDYVNDEMSESVASEAGAAMEDADVENIDTYGNEEEAGLDQEEAPDDDDLE